MFPADFVPESEHDVVNQPSLSGGRGTIYPEDLHDTRRPERTALDHIDVESRCMLEKVPFEVSTRLDFLNLDHATVMHDIHDML